MMCTFEGCVKQAQSGGRCLRHQDKPKIAAGPSPTNPGEGKPRAVDAREGGPAQPPTPTATPTATTNGHVIEWEDPPPQASARGRKAVRPFVAALAANPGRWAVYSRAIRSKGSAASIIRAAAKTAGVTAATASLLNDDGQTYTVWARVVEP